MTKIVQFHRMSTAQATLYTGPIGESIVDTGSFSLRVQDGATPGGFRTLMSNLNLSDLADKAISRGNLGAAPIDSPIFTTTARVNGPFGINMVPINILDITQVQNANSIAQIANTSAGVSASASVNSSNGTHAFALRMHGSLYTTAGIARQDGALLVTDGGGGMTYSIPSDAYRWYIGGTNYASIDASGTNFIGPVTSQTGGAAGSYTCTGFGVQANLDINGSITTTSGNGIRMVCVSAGVILNNGATAWASLSDETLKTPFIPFINALAKVASIKTGTGRYLTDNKNMSRSFMSAQSVQTILPEAVSVLKTSQENPDDPMAGKLMLAATDVIPLMLAAFKETNDRLIALEAK